MVRVTATNENGTGENYWTWNVLSTPPVVRRVNPAEQDVTDTFGSRRTFSTFIDQMALICISIDGFVMYTSDHDEQAASIASNKTSIGDYTVEVKAENSNGVGYNHWNWHIRASDAPVLIRENPTELDVFDPAFSRRDFEVSCNQPAWIIFRVDDRMYSKTFSIDPGRRVKCTIKGLPMGDYRINVSAINFNGNDQKHWDWHLGSIQPCEDGAERCVGHTLCRCIDGNWRIVAANSKTCGYQQPLKVNKYPHTINTKCLPFLPDYEVYFNSTEEPAVIETSDFKTWDIAGKMEITAIHREYMGAREIGHIYYENMFWVGNPDLPTIPTNGEIVVASLSEVNSDHVKKEDLQDLVEIKKIDVTPVSLKDDFKRKRSSSDYCSILNSTGIHPDSIGYMVKIDIEVYEFKLESYRDDTYTLSLPLDYRFRVSNDRQKVNAFTYHWGYPAGGSEIAGAVAHLYDVMSLIPEGGRVPRVTRPGRLVDGLQPYEILLKSSDFALVQDRLSDESHFTAAGKINWDPIWGPCQEE
ncbi:hypothetical protein [uncultured Methanoculleus sp.]|jgi:hypothetical protein